MQIYYWILDTAEFLKNDKVSMSVVSFSVSSCPLKYFSHVNGVTKIVCSVCAAAVEELPLLSSS